MSAPMLAPILALRTLSLGALPLTRAASRAAVLRGGRLGPPAMAASTIPVPAETPIDLTSVSVKQEARMDPAAWSGDLLVLPLWEADNSTALISSHAFSAVDDAYANVLTEMIEDHDFKGSAGSSAVLALPRGAAARRLAVVGLGKEDKYKTAGAAKLGRALATMAKDQKAKSMAVAMPTTEPQLQQAAIEHTLLGLSPDTRYKSGDEDENKPPPLVSLDLLGEVGDAVVSRARTVAAGVLLTKGLVGSPPNYLTPATMAATAEALAEQFPTMTLKVLEREDCEALGMGAYLGVAQGSFESTPPKFIHLTYTPPSGAALKKVAIVGKGLTFDSGGYNIKAGAGSMIEKMKFDMGGAGAVLGAARSIAELAPQVETHFIVAACENMVSAEAMRPGDILTASNAKTIEVLNTDAEGRLTLADALVYADKLGEVDCIVDIATLTGAAIVALGPDYGAVYTDSDDLLGRLTDAAAAGGEPLWRMPLAPEYVEQLKSPLADLKNLGGPGGGGSITAALFLKEFVGAESPDATWAHLDIAGPVWNDKLGGATGYGVRTLVGLVESMGE